MPELVDRPYTTPDLPALRGLWETVYEGASIGRREAAFRWVAERNPLCPGGAPRHLVMDDGRVAGTLGSLPVRCSAAGRVLELHFSHDLLVDPAYRGLGLGKRLVRQVAAAAPSVAGGLWMTGPCYALHQRMGWKPVKPFYGQALVLDAAALLRRRIRSRPAVALVGWAADAYAAFARRRIPRTAGPVEEIGRFGGGVDDLFERSAPGLGIIVERKSAYLNWKYAESPNVTYRRLLVGRPGSPDAYIVMRIHERADGHVNGTIVDLLADPARPAALDSAVAAAVEIARAGGAEVLYALVTHPGFRARLAALGFRRAPYRQTFVITGDEHFPAGVHALDAGNWYLTYGDSDGDMWSASSEPKRDRKTAA